ncbi:hypothetical protein QBC35DRAFT_506288 [Podospora australis]|uniref:Kinesin light chain n=1 Tax=Podospora australis TaxID=1536484 RepID=A0AAN6WPZ9_9PEZI|nr:hypothetical protein QBC35DRAFT_506288 [Podospora australis]
MSHSFFSSFRLLGTVQVPRRPCSLKSRPSLACPFPNLRSISNGNSHVPSRLRPEDYTIGWISALSIELTAAASMLSERHEQPPGLESIYTVGRIGNHNVVLACLPEGQMGTNSAATVARDLMQDFPGIRFGLMVGIGGGVPSKKKDIRLGDVVVSKPRNGHSGVVQYDFGKSVTDGFQRTGSLNNPPNLLLTAVSHMKAKQFDDWHPITSHLDRLPRMPQDKFARPPAGEDRLYKATYKHEAADGDCSGGCDPSQLIQREPRKDGEVQVFYGTIASGNQVMKNGEVRDDISAKLGGVLCFEMEAAGLMNNFPCLVIRGICDYCDSHKNDQWQPFAAGIAAAYARELLSFIPAAKVTEELHTVQTVTNPAQDSHDCRDTSCWEVPLDQNPRFVGHQSRLETLEKRLCDDDDCHSIALYGLGGGGKTQLALELAYRIRKSHRHPGRKVFWVSATSVENFERDFMRIALHLRLPGTTRCNQRSDIKRLVRDHLSQEQSGPWLIILDGADDIDLVLEHGGLASYLPRSELGKLIITTRHKTVASRLSRVVEELSPMDEETATELLRASLNNAEPVKDKQSTQKLLQALAYWPFCIVYAASYMNEVGLDIIQYLCRLEELDGNVMRLLGSGSFYEQGSGSQAVNSTWLLSFNQIKKQPLAEDYLSFMACLDPTDIPRSLLPSSRLPSGVDDRGMMGAALDTLSAFSFVNLKSIDGGPDRSLDMQQLVHHATRDWLKKNNRLETWSRTATDKLTTIFSNLDRTNRDQITPYLHHAVFLLTSNSRHHFNFDDAELRHMTGMCLMNDGRYKEAEKLLDDVVKTRTISHGAKDEKTLLSMAGLAATYREQGRWKEAEALGAQVVSAQEDVLGPGHRSTLESMAGLAWTFRKLGRWDDAEELGHKVLAHLRFCKRDRDDVLLALDTKAHLAKTYKEQGKWDAALRLAKEVYKEREKILGKDHRDVLDALALRATVQAHKGEFRKARKKLEICLARQKMVLGQEHPLTLETMAILSRTYRQQARYQESERLANRVLECRVRILGAEHPKTTAIMAQIAWLYRKQGRLTESIELWDQVTLINIRSLGEKHPMTLNSMNGLSRAHREIADASHLREAEELARRTMEIQYELLGPEHPWTLGSFANLAVIARKQGMMLEAEEYGRYVLDAQTRRFGGDHPWTADNAIELARTLRAKGDLEEAEKLAEQVLRAREAVFRSERSHPEVLESNQLLEEIRREQALRPMGMTVSDRRPLGMWHVVDW